MRLRALLSVAVVATASAVARAQDTDGGAPVHESVENQEWFFGWIIALLVIVPVLLTAFLARRRAKSKPSTLPVWDDETFEAEVLQARQPVLVHFAEDWNITNAAAKAQTEILAYLNRGAVLVGYLDVHASPRLMERFPGFVAPAYLLFLQGRKLFHRPGLWQAEDLQEHIDRALAREGF